MPESSNGPDCICSFETCPCEDRGKPYDIIPFLNLNIQCFSNKMFSVWNHGAESLASIQTVAQRKVLWFCGFAPISQIRNRK